jgi:hypothetical protein
MNQTSNKLTCSKQTKLKISEEKINKRSDVLDSTTPVLTDECMAPYHSNAAMRRREIKPCSSGLKTFSAKTTSQFPYCFEIQVMTLIQHRINTRFFGHIFHSGPIRLIYGMFLYFVYILCR